MSNEPRIYVDFLNSGGQANQVVLDRSGTMEDLRRYGITLRDGLVLHLYMDDADDSDQPDNLIVDGVVHYDEERKRWVATYDPASFKHESELKDDD
jgi:hypothetical protein